MHISKEQLQRFARYEIPYSELTSDPRHDTYEPYDLTTEDIIAVVEKLDSMFEEPFLRFWDEWLVPVFDMASPLNEVLRTDDLLEEDYCTRGLIESDKDLLLYVLHAFDDLPCWRSARFPEKAQVGQVIEVDLLLDVIRCYLFNKPLPFTKWEFPYPIKEDYIDYIYEKEGEREEISEEEKELFHRYVEEMIALHNITALKAKGFLSYGGSSLYPCDWQVSRDCLQKAFELSQDPTYANALGYIYYYGRCNGFKPEYEKAFPYFVYGYIHKLYESTYKLADMYKGGKGVVQSTETYRKIIEELYGYALGDLCNGEDKKFADVALRMGGVYEDVYGDLQRAYGCYLQADYALKRRMEEEHYGDDQVAGYIREALERTRDSVEHKGKVFRSDGAAFLGLLEEDHEDCVVEIKKLKKGYKLVLHKLHPTGRHMLITLPEHDYCVLTDTITLYSQTEDLPTGSFIFDDHHRSLPESQNIVLTFAGEVVLELPGELEYRIK